MIQIWHKLYNTIVSYLCLTISKIDSITVYFQLRANQKLLGVYAFNVVYKVDLILF